MTLLMICHNIFKVTTTTVFCNVHSIVTTGTHLENLISINNGSILTALIHKNIILQIVVEIYFCMELINRSLSEMFLLSK